MSALPEIDELEWALINPAMFGYIHAPYIGAEYEIRPHLEEIANAIADAVGGVGPRLILVSMPPRYGKSETICRWACSWRLEWDPKARVAVASYGSAFSKTFGAQVREDLFNLHTAGRVRVRPRMSSGTAGDWRTTAGGGMFCPGVLGGFMGRGVNMLCVDDPYKLAEEAESQTYRERIWQWWLKVARPRLEPGGVAIIVHTRWHEDDLIGRIQRELQDAGHMDQVKVLSFSAVATRDERIGRTTRAKDEPLWPERFTRQDLRITEMFSDESTWQALYQQSPSPPEGAIFKRSWWARGRARYDPTDERLNEQCWQRWISWDTALKDKEDAAYSVAVVGELLHDLRLRIRHVLRLRMDFPELLRVARELEFEWNLDRRLGGTVIEDRASGVSLYQSMLPYLGTSERISINDPIPELVAFQPSNPKPIRARQASIYCKLGAVELPMADETVPWLMDYEHELFAVPKAATWDQVDATSQLILYLEHYLAEGVKQRGGFDVGYVAA